MAKTLHWWVIVITGTVIITITSSRRSGTPLTLTAGLIVLLASGLFSGSVLYAMWRAALADPSRWRVAKLVGISVLTTIILTTAVLIALKFATI